MKRATDLLETNFLLKHFVKINKNTFENVEKLVIYLKIVI